MAKKRIGIAIFAKNGKNRPPKLPFAVLETFRHSSSPLDKVPQLLREGVAEVFGGDFRGAAADKVAQRLS